MSPCGRSPTNTERRESLTPTVADVVLARRYQHCLPLAGATVGYPVTVVIGVTAGADRAIAGADPQGFARVGPSLGILVAFLITVA